MNNFTNAVALGRSFNRGINLIFKRNARGQINRRKPTDEEKISSSSKFLSAKNIPRSQELNDHELTTPKPGQQQLGQSAMAALTEDKMQQLAESMPPKNRPHPQEILQEEIKTEPEIDPVTESNQYERLAECVTPLHRMSYSDQLQYKQKKAETVLRDVRKRLRTVSVNDLPVAHSGMPCPLYDIQPSPDLLHYRNKDEFVVRTGVDGDPKTVGFLTGAPHLSTTVCVRPTHLINIRDSHKAVCQHFEQFIRSSGHGSCLHFRDSPGVWRSVMVRSNKAGNQLMAVVIIHPHTLNQDEISEIEEDLRNYFFTGPGSDAGITSLYLQICGHTKCSREQAPYKLLQGETHITETCSNLTFDISPDTFFQINNSAAELLYSTVKEVTEVSGYSTLLDVCCGSGSIGLLMANSVRGVVGIESGTSAVEDANRNAKLNNIQNATFIPGPAEKILPLLKNELVGCTDLLAVVNPGRGGIHPRVIQSLRATPGISKLLYLSCRPEGYASDNFVSLGNMIKRNKLSRHPPLLPHYAFTVDMFPHTDHYEMGILFVRHDMDYY